MKYLFFFSNPENLEKVTPKYLNFKINSKPPFVMRKGQCFDYQLRVRGIPMKWTSLISLYDPPYCFVDEQITGPYSSWHHTHTFNEENGGTSIIDVVKYSLPLGFIGKIINLIWVKKDLDAIFKYRQKMIERTLKNISND
jgi:ligand-binding SRPBCC domain-containing protein